MSHEDLGNWVHALKLHKYRPTTISERGARTLRDQRLSNGLAKLGAYRRVGGKVFICLPIYDWWFLNAEQTKDKEQTMSDERLRLYHATTIVGVDVPIEADSWEDAFAKVQEEWVNAGPIRLTMREYIEVGFQSTLVDTDYPDGA